MNVEFRRLWKRRPIAYSPGTAVTPRRWRIRPSYPWLAVPALERDGRLRHRRGVTAVPGLYAIGLRFQSRRNSTFIDGARHDAAYLADRITSQRARRLAG